MNQKLKKIGIVQTAPLPGDFSNNLRSIVQGYRECLDRGAEIVITSLYALSGLTPGDLMRRRSFLKQLENAAETLAEELSLTDVPLITGYAINPLISGADDDYDDVWEADDGLLYDEDEKENEMHSSIVLMPCLIHRGNIRVLTDSVSSTIGAFLCHITSSAEENLPEGQVDLIIHMPESPWYNLSAEKEHQVFCWESHQSNAPVVCVHPVGTCDGKLYGGGSALYINNKISGILPYFEPACYTLHLNRKNKITDRELLSQVEKALVRGIRDSVHQNGYTGVCIPMDLPNAQLLAALCTEALGTGNVVGISFSETVSPGIENKMVDASALIKQASALLVAEDSEGLEQRIKGSLAATIAENKGLMLLSPLDRHRLMLGAFTLYGESNGYLAPLGNLYQIDLYLLNQYMAERNPDITLSVPVPEHAEEDRIIHELSERNISASDILKLRREGDDENSVRFIQRKIIASALKRTQTPLVLYLSDPAEQLSFPIAHRLND